MKSLKIFALTLMIIAVSACAQAQYRSVRGNHDVTRKDRNVDNNFTGIKVSSGIDVFLSQGDHNSVTVEADENLHEYIITEVKGDVLNIYSEANIRDAERKRAYVTMKEINSVRTTSAGDVTGETPVRADHLELSASSAGNINLEVTAKEINLDISSSGDITISGEADILDGSLSSAGDLNAFDLKVRDADISASSAGNANVNVSERIRARSSSAGDINYKGNPQYIDAHSSSAGGIHKR